MFRRRQEIIRAPHSNRKTPMQDTQINSFLSKVQRTRIHSSESRTPDLTGITLPEGFLAESRLPVSSGEADIYTARDPSGKQYILKYYRRENAIKDEVIRLLREIRNPCVAPVSAYGIYEGHQYVIMPYYRNMNLAEMMESGNTLSAGELKTLVIPSVNEGLRAVHEKGILHKDLKPANLIPDDTGEHIVLIDFGISSAASGRTLVVTATGMTPIYAAPEVLQGIYHSSSDYYSFGITVFELFTGYPPFQNSALSEDDVIRLAAVNKIEFPENFPEDLRELVQGLTYKDISNRNSENAINRRWGYREVRDWLAGIRVPVPGSVPDTAPAFLPYVFEKVRYTDEEELIKAFLTRPDRGIREVGRGILSHHYSLFRDESCRLCEEYAGKLSGARGPAKLGAFLSLMYRIGCHIGGIFCGGEFFENLSDLGNRAVEAINAGDSAFIKPAAELFQSGFLTDYARNIIKSDTAARIFENLAAMFETRELSDSQKVYATGVALSQNHSFVIAGKKYASPEEFKNVMDASAAKYPESYAKQLVSIYEELEFLVFAIPGEQEKALLKKHLKNDFVFFGSGDYIFRDREHLRNRISEIASGNAPWEILYLERCYHRGISELAHREWHDDELPSLLSASVSRVRERLRIIMENGRDEVQVLAGDLKKLPARARTRCLRGILCECGPEFREILSGIPGTADLLKGIKTASDSEIPRGHIHILNKSWPERLLIGNTYYFGKWYQDNSRNKTPLAWYCLCRDGRYAVLMSVRILCYRPFYQSDHDFYRRFRSDDFNEGHMKVWRDSDLREWLNTVFLNEAFTPDEQRYLAETEHQEYREYLECTKDGRSGHWTRKVTDTCRDRIFVPRDRTDILYAVESAYRDEERAPLFFKPEATPYALSGENGSMAVPECDRTDWWRQSYNLNICFPEEHPFWDKFTRKISTPLGVRPFIRMEL